MNAEGFDFRIQPPPLAARMRPRSLDELKGQEHVLGPGKPLRILIEADSAASIILWGPAGSGKTSVARIIAERTKARFSHLSAVNATVAEVRKVISDAVERLKTNGRRTILFLDEIHRFTRSQQDALLPAVEEGIISLIGATTENPYFSINSPLLSRSALFRLEPLPRRDVLAIMRSALEDSDRGLASLNLQVGEGVLEHIVDRSGGDARVALNALEMCASAAAGKNGKVDLALAQQTLSRPILHNDRQSHYDVISAFIKSMRGSDPDAAVWWLAEMLEAGEDPRYIARRMIIFASEDVGNAEPEALLVAVAAAQAVEFVGLPEVSLNLAHAAIFLAAAPKSNASAMAISQAIEDVATAGRRRVPSHLTDSHSPQGGGSGYGQKYIYPHDSPSGFVEQEYLPAELAGRTLYVPTARGREKQIAEWLKELRGPAPGA